MLPKNKLHRWIVRTAMSDDVFNLLLLAWGFSALFMFSILFSPACSLIAK